MRVMEWAGGTPGDTLRGKCEQGKLDMTRLKYKNTPEVFKKMCVHTTHESDEHGNVYIKKKNFIREHNNSLYQYIYDRSASREGKRKTCIIIETLRPAYGRGFKNKKCHALTAYLNEREKKLKIKYRLLIIDYIWKNRDQKTYQIFKKN